MAGGEDKAVAVDPVGDPRVHGEGFSEKDGADITDLVGQLVETSRLEAQMAIDAAVAANGDQGEIDKALEEMDKATGDLADGDPDKAIDHYKKAVEKAVKAL